MALAVEPCGEGKSFVFVIDTGVEGNTWVFGIDTCVE